MPTARSAKAVKAVSAKAVKTVSAVSAKSVKGVTARSAKAVKSVGTALTPTGKIKAVSVKRVK